MKKGIEVLDNLKKNKKVEESGPVLKPFSKVYLKVFSDTLNHLEFSNE